MPKGGLREGAGRPLGSRGKRKKDTSAATCLTQPSPPPLHTGACAGLSPDKVAKHGNSTSPYNFRGLRARERVENSRL
jgi:hypothetical protein